MIFKILLLLISVFYLTSCKDDVKNKEVKKSTNNSIIKKEEEKKIIINKKDLVEIKQGKFIEFYPNKKTIKFQGQQDKNGKRHGKWQYFSENGIELSMTMYQHGEKHGHTIVKYPNGNIHYSGEYENGKKIGLWRSYSIDGQLVNEIDYSNL
mgnify:CR=1 FL=1